MPTRRAFIATATAASFTPALPVIGAPAPAAYQGATHYSMCIQLHRIAQGRRLMSEFPRNDPFHRIGRYLFLQGARLARALYAEHDHAANTAFRAFGASGYTSAPDIP